MAEPDPKDTGEKQWQPVKADEIADALRSSKRAAEVLVSLLEENGSKICQLCDVVKPFGEYSPNAKSRDGYEYRCRQCHREKVRNWAAENPEKRAERDRRRDHVARNRLQEERHPEKMRARRIFRQAVYEGRVIKPSGCERCGVQASGRHLHGHHHDYSKPLDVEWLCRKCHGEEHRIYDDNVVTFPAEEERDRGEQ